MSFVCASVKQDKAELDRFCDALISIRAEIQEVADGRQTLENNILVNAPHTNEALLAKDWDKPYSRERAAYPAPWLREGAGKFWPTTGRVDNVYGDRNLSCSCPPLTAYMEAAE